MKKFQAPVLGGFRKMITLPPTTVGTTIAEIGAGTITLSQLAAAINNILTGTGTTTTGAAQAANLVVGPGLTGGGALVGNVPLRITAPIPWGMIDDGADGDQGPQGVPGPRGLQGVPGQFLMPEDGQDGDWGPPGAAGAVGATGATGPQGPQGPAGTGTGSGGTGTLMMFVPEDTSYDDLLPIPGAVGPRGLQGLPGAALIAEDTSYEDILSMPGPVGPQGATGATGAAGPSLHIVAEDPYWEEEIYKGLPSAVGPLTINGPLTVNGLVSVMSAQPISELFSTTNSQGTYQQFNNSAGSAYGYLGGAGTNFGTGFGAADFAIACGTLATATLRLCVNGGNTTAVVIQQDGSVVVGLSAVGGDLGNYCVNVQGSVSACGTLPAAQVGRTDIGITTTGTVITTAGGIALPALAKTFWVVNVNGVAYGVPCFAL